MAEPQSPSPLLTIRETADYLKLSLAYVYELISAKRLPVVKFGSRTMLTRTALDEFIAENTRAAAVTRPRKRGRPAKFPDRRKRATDERRAEP